MDTETWITEETASEHPVGCKQNAKKPRTTTTYRTFVLDQLHSYRYEEEMGAGAPVGSTGGPVGSTGGPSCDEVVIMVVVNLGCCHDGHSSSEF